jgi:mono/diheme cytochrome c family protein
MIRAGTSPPSPCLLPCLKVPPAARLLPWARSDLLHREEPSCERKLRCRFSAACRPPCSGWDFFSSRLRRRGRKRLNASALRSARSSCAAPEIFSKQCAVCHGDKGDGQGKFAYLMDPRPRDLLAGKFKITTTENLIPSDADLLRTLRRGMPGSAMPPWGHLPEADLQALVAYVRSLHLQGVSAEVEAAVASGMLPESEAPAIIEQRTAPGDPPPRSAGTRIRFDPVVSRALDLSPGLRQLSRPIGRACGRSGQDR